MDQHVPHALEFDFTHPTESAPDRNPELVAPHVAVPGHYQLGCQPLAFAAVRTVTIEHDGSGAVGVNQPPNFDHIRDIGRGRHARLWRHVLRPGDMADGVLSVRASIKYNRATTAEHVGQLFRGNLVRWLSGLAK